jgi:hypothetical protein
MFWKKKETTLRSEASVLSLGTPNSGKCHYPWDDLKPCPCGCKERPLLLYAENRLYHDSGTIKDVFAVCSVCGRHTEKADIPTTINSWNKGEVRKRYCR